MKYGFVLPYGDARTAAEYAFQAEQAGWDGFFVWEPVWGIDAWVSLAAAAMRTTHIRLGTLLSPIARMRPWKLASETATLDNLSGGRVILSVGLGAVDTGFREFGEVTDRKQRVELMEEGLEIVCGLWAGQPFNYAGKHYTIEECNFYPPPPPVSKIATAGAALRWSAAGEHPSGDARHRRHDPGAAAPDCRIRRRSALCRSTLRHHLGRSNARRRPCPGSRNCLSVGASRRNLVD